jgi:hypothetical protein
MTDTQRYIGFVFQKCNFHFERKRLQCYLKEEKRKNKKIRRNGITLKRKGNPGQIKIEIDTKDE